MIESKNYLTMNNKLIIISGPTASGKTKTSIELAKLFSNSAIVNFDSLLFYKEISIGTAKPTPAEMDGIEHYMIDIESIRHPMNAAQFIEKGEAIINELFKKNKIVFLVGGSAFYLRALLKGMYESKTPGDEIKNRIEKIYNDEGIESIIDYLKIHDPEALELFHVNDHYRLMRAAIHFEATKTKISAQKKELDLQDPYDFTSIIHPWNILHIYLDLPKDEHFKIIRERTQKMFKNGLLDEIENLKNSGFSLSEKPLSSIGYKEAIQYLNGEIKDIEQCIEKVAISTRQLAKSQRTFFNKIAGKELFNPIDDQDRMKSRVTEFVKE